MFGLIKGSVKAFKKSKDVKEHPISHRLKTHINKLIKNELILLKKNYG